MGSEEDTYNTIFHALKHPIRRRILRQIDAKPSTFTELLNELGIDNGLLNYHLNNLKELITKGEDEKYRLSEFGTATLSLTRRVEEPLHSPSDTFLGLSPLLFKSVMAILIIGIGVLGFLYVGLNNRYSVLETRYEAIQMNQIEERRSLESEIVYETLKISLIDKQIPDFNLLTQNTNNIILSNELIEDVEVPNRIGSYKINLMSTDEIEEKAEAEGAFQYLLFTRFELNPNNIMVTITTAGVFDAGGGMTIQYRLTGTIYQWWIA